MSPLLDYPHEPFDGHGYATLPPSNLKVVKDSYRAVWEWYVHHLDGCGTPGWVRPRFFTDTDEELCAAEVGHRAGLQRPFWCYTESGSLRPEFLNPQNL